MIKLASIGHVLLRVADEEASKRFYRDVSPSRTLNMAACS
jgi:catechol 2,3-dioxygenase-like lactoylglutathione lyase family enzyme